MNRASPVEMRKVLAIVETMKQAGVLFVPMPVLNQEDHEHLLTQMSMRLNQIEKECDE